MKRKIAIIWIIILMMGLSGCGRTNESANEETASGQTEANRPSQTSDFGTDSSENNDAGTHILIAYFAVAENSDVDAVSSASVAEVDGEAKGLLRIVAEDIQSVTGGDLFSIQTSVDYPGDVNELIDYALEEQEEDARPELTSHIENLNQYDTIFVGYPLWWYDLPQVMYSFFDEYDFSGKTIIPFDVHNGSRLSDTVAAIQELEPDAAVITDGFAVSHNNAPDASEDVVDWLEELGF